MASLPLAIAFCLALNSFFVFGWLYPNWISGGLFWMATLVGVTVWGFYVVRGLRELPELIHPRKASEEPDRFGEAHAAYLRGDWEAAEKLLTSVLAIEPRDPPALLMLCAVYRKLDQLDHATVLINEISRLEVADPWWVEVETERKRIRRAMAAEAESKDRTKSDARENPANDEAAPPEDAADMTEDRATAA
ncbi:putative membrane protein [Rhodopirellula maiorica SM1]|uniref:Putative membrane protein n=2 Tax=Novipirellula TaxID=2795426 RepID=M5RSV3_9BACT|nr:putative membrane protein [Rhodopirellula maiorica SM1]